MLNINHKCCTDFVSQIIFHKQILFVEQNRITNKVPWAKHNIGKTRELESDFQDSVRGKEDEKWQQTWFNKPVG